MAIFPKFFGDFMWHIIRQNAGEKIKYFLELFINKKLITLLSDSFRIRVENNITVCTLLKSRTALSLNFLKINIT